MQVHSETPSSNQTLQGKNGTHLAAVQRLCKSNGLIRTIESSPLPLLRFCHTPALHLSASAKALTTTLICHSAIRNHCEPWTSTIQTLVHSGPRLRGHGQQPSRYGGHHTHTITPLQDPDGSGRCCKMKPPSPGRKSELNHPSRRGIGCRSTTKYHLNLNVDNVFRHPHATNSPRPLFGRFPPRTLDWTLKCLPCLRWLEHFLYPPYSMGQ